MPGSTTENQLINQSEYNHHIFTHFDFSRGFEYVSSIPASSTTQLPEVFIYQNKLTRNRVAVAPLLSPEKIGELHRNLLITAADKNIDKFYYSSHVNSSANSQGSTVCIDIKDIQVLVVTREKPAQLHYDIRSQTTQRQPAEDDESYTNRINTDIKNTYAGLINACLHPTITKNPYGRTNDSDLGDQILTPLIAMTGRVLVEMTDQEKAVNLNRRTGRLINHDDLQLITKLHDRNGREFSMDSVFALNPEKSYFYLVGLLLSGLSGFENLSLQGISVLPPNFQYPNNDVADRCAELEGRGILADPKYTGNIDNIPEIGRVFYNPITGKSIAVMAPGYDDLEQDIRGPIERKCDHVIKMDIQSAFSEAIRNRLQELDFGITETAQLCALMFEETPPETLPLRRRANDTSSSANNVLSSFATTANTAEGNSFTTPTASQQASPARPTGRESITSFRRNTGKNTSQTPARSGVLTNKSPWKSLTQSPAALEKARDLMFNLSDRLTAEGYYTSLNGLLLLNGYQISTINHDTTDRADEPEISRQFSLPIDEANTAHVILHKPCSLEAAISDLRDLPSSSTKQIYLIQEEKKPLRVLYSNGIQTYLYIPNTTLKNQPWEPPVAGQIEIDNPNIIATAVPVTCPDYSFEHNVFHELYRKLIDDNILTQTITGADGVITAKATRPNTLETVKSYALFSTAHTPNDQKIEITNTEPYAGSLSINTIPAEDEESVVVAAYRHIVKNCYSMGMTLISRVVDAQYHDLAFIFQQIGTDRYFVIRHPTHPTTIPKEVLKGKVVAKLEELKLPLNQLDVISFADDPPKYPKVAALSPIEETSLTGKNIKTLYDALPKDDSTPETRANLHFKQLVLDYIQNGYTVIGHVVGQHKYKDAQGNPQTADYTQAVIFKGHSSNECHIITHPYHKNTTSKAQLDSAVERHLAANQTTFAGTAILPKRYFKDDAKTPRHVVTLKRTDGAAIVVATHRRTEKKDQEAENVIVTGVMAHMGYTPHSGNRNDPRPPYKVAEPKPVIDFLFKPRIQFQPGSQQANTEKPFWSKTWWQKTKEHFQRHAGKYKILAGCVIGLVGGLTGGLGLIPIAIGIGVGGGVGGLLILWGASSVKDEYYETKASEQAIELVEEQCSSTLGIIQKLDRHGGDAPRGDPAPSGGPDSKTPYKRRRTKAQLRFDDKKPLPENPNADIGSQHYLSA